MFNPLLLQSCKMLAFAGRKCAATNSNKFILLKNRCQNRHFKTSTFLHQENNGGDNDDKIDTDEAIKGQRTMLSGNELLELGKMPFDTDIGPKVIPHHKYHEEDYKFAFNQKRKLQQYELEEEEGTVGSSSLLSINTEEIDRHLPTLDTIKTLYDGVPYDELPIAYVKATYTNTIVGVFNAKGSSIIYTSAGCEGFKNRAKCTSISGQTVGASVAQKLLRRGVNTVRVVVKGVGQGRMTAVKALASGGINVVSITDRTLLPELGPRPRKIRRV